MRISVEKKRRRNQDVTRMLMDRCNIQIDTVDRNDAIKQGNWFMPTKKTGEELKIVYR